MFKNPIVLVLILFVVASSAYIGFTDGLGSMFELLLYFLIGGIAVLLIEYFKRMARKNKR